MNDFNEHLQDVPVTRLTGVGAALSKKLEKVGISSLQDLLFHLPLRYQDRTAVSPMHSVEVGRECAVQGEVLSCDVLEGRRRSMFLRISDGSGSVGVRFYHFSGAQKRRFAAGVRIWCFGELRIGASGLEMYHPEYRLVKESEPEHETTVLTPVYPTTEGLGQQRLRGLCLQALQFVRSAGALPDWLPETLCSRFGLISLHQAVACLHQPPREDLPQLLEGTDHPARKRLAFEELLAHHLSLQKLRQSFRKVDGCAMPSEGELVHRFKERLSFNLTKAQQRVAAEIEADLVQPVPMLRLVQGDVGSGKTVVAALAALQAVESGFQVAIMAPTEILAEQHEQNFRDWFTPLGIKTAFLTGKVKGKQRQHCLDETASGESMVIVGTHALFQQDVQFKRLGLVVVDEQHRFGVHQRMLLRNKGQLDRQPHQLVMTATPIPRTLAMSAYADLDCSVIDQLPPGRTPVNTVVIGDDRRDEVMERLRIACQGGRQAYWVCTLIETSETLQCRAAETSAEQLREALPELSVGLIHGRMSARQKLEIMRDFKEGHLHLLVATTVIEVGVDVPNASLMIIENPERLGLAQLHQLRGRVGRGSVASHCLLMYQTPLSQQGRRRLGILRESSDGFVIAEKDLEIRGPGEVMGTRQTGLAQMKVADLQRDADMMAQVREASRLLMEQAPESVDPLIDRWVGASGEYAAI